MRKLWVAVTSVALVVAGLADSTAGFWGWRRCRHRPACSQTCVDPCSAAPAETADPCVTIDSACEPCIGIVSDPCLETPTDVILEAPAPAVETLPDAAPAPADPQPLSAAPSSAAPAKIAAPAAETPPTRYVAPRPIEESTTSTARPTIVAPAPAERATAVRPQTTPAAPAETRPAASTPAQPQAASSSTNLPSALLEILGEPEPAVLSPAAPSPTPEAAAPATTDAAAEVPAVDDLWEAPTAEPSPEEEAAAPEATPGPAEEPADEPTGAPAAFDPSELFGPSTAPESAPAAAPSVAPANRYGQPLFEAEPETRSPAPLLNAPLPTSEPIVAPPSPTAPLPTAEPPSDPAPSESTEPDDEPQAPADRPKLNPKDLFGSRTPHSVLLEPGGLGSFAVRRWQDISGRYALEARLRRITPAAVVLEGSDGAQAEVELVALSTEDLRFLQRQIVAKRADLAQQRERGPKTFVAQSPEER